MYGYVSIAEVRDEGFSDVTEYPDALLEKWIKRATSKIDTFTKQFFVPKAEIYQVDGQSSVYLVMPHSIPIIKINAISIDFKKTSPRTTYSYCPFTDNRAFGDLLEDDYSLSENDRKIELLDTGFCGFMSSYPYSSYDSSYKYREYRDPNVFPEGSRNISVDGVFGWQENKKDYKTDLSTQYNSGESFLYVSDSSGLDKYDSILILHQIGSVSKVIYRRIYSINYGTNELTIDPIEGYGNIPIATVVCSFGQIPCQIVEATLRLVSRFAIEIIDPENSSGNCKNITEETIDNYKWKTDSRFSVFGSDRQYLTYGSTGDLLVDRLLDEFLPLPYVGHV